MKLYVNFSFPWYCINECWWSKAIGINLFCTKFAGLEYLEYLQNIFKVEKFIW